jgi:peptide/nickel transport system permease protein
MRNRGNHKLQRFWQEQLIFKVSGCFLFFYLVCALGAPFFPLPFGPEELDLANLYQAPFDWSRSGNGKRAHLLGTDGLGRDVLTNLIYGCRTSFLISFTVMGLATLLGLALGSIAGFFGDRSLRVTYLSLSCYLLALPLPPPLNCRFNLFLASGWWFWFLRWLYCSYLR